MTDYFSEPGSSRTEIYQELAQLRLIDPHTHINPHAPASSTLADLLGYHYYTELARSAGMPKNQIEDPSIGPKELVERLVGGLGPIENTIQYSWLIAICRTFFGFDEDKLHLNNWEELYDRSESIMASAQWPDMVLDQSNIEAVFLTNDFDDDLAGFDSDRYIPCLRTDDLVFHLADPNVRDRLAACSGIELDGSLSSLRASLRQRFEHFVDRGARACAISLPPSFTPTSVADGRATTALDSILKNGLTASANDKEALSRRIFWTLAELCDEFGLPFDLMIGVNRKVYPDGVYQGQDLFDSRVSLIQYKDLFNAFPDVKFPVSVLASVTNQELVSYAWIFPNVYPNGHWWYSNTPSTIKHDLGARLDAVPQTKMIGYYSDAYKLEFVWPKFDMYRKTLASVLAEDFVGNRGWSIERAVELGRQVLKENTEEIFPRVTAPKATPSETPIGSVTTGDSQRADSDVIEVDEFEEIEMFDNNDDQSTSAAVEQPGNAASLAASGAAAAAAVGLAAAEVIAEDDIAEDNANNANNADDADDADDASELFSTVEVDPFDTSEVTPSPAESPDQAESPNQAELSEVDSSESTLSGAERDEPFPIDAEGDDAFDTMVVEPADRDGNDDDGPSNSSEPMDTNESEEDLGATIVLNENLTKVEFAEDSAATVVEPPPSKDNDLSKVLAVDAVDAATEISADEDEVDSQTTIPVDLTNPLDPVPKDDEIGELDLDDVELIDPIGSRATDPETLSAETDDEPLDVGDLLSADDGPSADDTSDDDDSLLQFDSLTEEIGGDDSKSDDARGGEAQIRQLTGESSFAPDEESLKLESDPLTGELNFKVSDDDDDDEFSLSPESPEPASETQASEASESETQASDRELSGADVTQATASDAGGDEDDDDEFNLEWLNEDEK